MPGMNGLEVAKEIRTMYKRAGSIFITSYSDYVFSSFEVQPFRFVILLLRDELLPKLMVGDIDLSDIELLKR